MLESLSNEHVPTCLTLVLAYDSGTGHRYKLRLYTVQQYLELGYRKKEYQPLATVYLLENKVNSPRRKTSFLPNKEEAIFLCWDSSVINGAYVGCINSVGIFTTRKVSAPTPWPNASIPMWKLVRNPLGQENIWVIKKGRLLWDTPKEGELLTF